MYQNTSSLLFSAAVLALAGCGASDDTKSQSFENSPHLSGLATSSAGATRTEVIADVVMDPYGILGGGPIGTFDPGVIKCPGHEPTGNPLEPCPLESRLHFRGFSFTSRVVARDGNPLYIAWVHVTGNIEWDADGTGTLAGKFEAELDAGGAWLGSWHGKRSVVPGGCFGSACWVEHIEVVGSGSGALADLHVQASEELFSYQRVPLAFHGTEEAVILATP